MAAKIQSRLLKSGSFLRLAYSAPLPQEKSAADIRRYALAAVKALPFVKLRPNDQPMWRPESFWHVRPTGKWERDVQIGRKYARQAIKPQLSILGHCARASLWPNCGCLKQV